MKMEKLKSFATKVKDAAPSASATSNKLSKAFKFDGNKGVLGNGTDVNPANPFLDGPNLEESHLYLHLASLFFTFLAICTIGAVAGFQAKWAGVSGGVGFTLFMLMLAFVLQCLLVIVPLVYDRWDKLKRPAQFLAQTRSTLILHFFGTALLFLSAMIITISSFTQPGCKNPDEDPNASKGDEFKSGLAQWCTTKKASGVFDWFGFIMWVGLVILSGLKFRRERRREPGFIPPVNGDGGVEVGLGLGYDHNAGGSYSGNNTATFGDKHEEQGNGDMGEYNHVEPVSGGYETAGFTQYSGRVGGGESGVRFANNNGGGGISRTMQLAQQPTGTVHFDPYAQIRDSLITQSRATDTNYGYGQNAGLYSQGGGGMPQPPAYGYRQ